MDTSKEYVKMWLASELEVKPDDYQPWACPKCLKVYSPENMPLQGWHWCHNFVHVDLVPLPRQDQLWQMLPQIKEHDWILQRYVSDGKSGWALQGGHSLTIEFQGETAEQALVQGAIYEKKRKEGGGTNEGSSNCTGGSGS